ncbi:hypothetical protein CPAST_c07260 [Clostridium pasteurianum DSM 525 = ATCC 6013]|uniref:Uncharacterized protein n=1 Tax=Clostridium pasteurianum DSM 525 = ATCC 6013 TaxID=1262449 RepID=A0A0H3IZ76_CLOPA|nr:hypothetical protein [Clostridium pasteurianum]AJA46826.1 hypothetical protein CPAST_c07260 [Clostridium pasteurianum DSM 525 = ATCC 6013]AJA50814.1 hypothetical protein CLPA_c07260 [Clostridium pasteurianum DSM 525 = ATCC 6013]AOZ74219.1 hypothetical protein AQ983_03500 [Clostridium pasteurianum DSM 525 = ATCC 6013]AOZ78017.1 hypothetical protein AQ984_03500 [Clostridium pasteurianum]ELP58563.1 hypothetical protein F502_13825 [Clostridium pasteurianum DSM 525 = ATCC 6013]
MFKNKSTYIFIAIILVIICIIISIKLFSSNITISIKNNTDKTVAGLKIKYSHLNNDIEVPQIPKNQIYKTKIILPENFTEGSIKIYYIDKQGENHEEYLEGYIEKGYKGNITTTIDSVDNNGILSIKVHK